MLFFQGTNQAVACVAVDANPKSSILGMGRYKQSRRLTPRSTESQSPGQHVDIEDIWSTAHGGEISRESLSEISGGG